jgi:site-specific recombinase XerD
MMKTNTDRPLAPYVRTFFENHLACQRNVSCRTIQSYRDAMKIFLGFAAASRKKPAALLLVEDIDEALVSRFLTDLERSRGNSIQTRNHRLAVLRGFFGYVASQEPALLDVCRKILTIPLKKGAADPAISYLEREEMMAILDAVDRREPLGLRDYALLLFLYNSGARVQEAADARISWIGFQKPFRVEILGKGRKLRTCPLWENTVRALRELNPEAGTPRGSDRHLFLNRLGCPLSRSGIADIVEKYTRRAAERQPSLRGRKVTPHTIRHTTAMHLLQSGVEVNVIRSWLGHVSLSTTNQYVQIDLKMKAKALEACEDIAGRGPAPRWKSNPDILAWLETL